MYNIDFFFKSFSYNIFIGKWSWTIFVLGVPESDDEVDGVITKEVEHAKLKKEEEELTKIASGIGKVFLKNVQEREKMKQWKAANLDPRNASR